MTLLIIGIWGWILGGAVWQALTRSTDVSNTSQSSVSSPDRSVF
ncbi:hypothetical protein [Sulfobacillus thermosulfidooxidans]|nr:hypothetical protein [Sulfobacillus thermosulfidooxidans]